MFRETYYFSIDKVWTPCINVEFQNTMLLSPIKGYAEFRALLARKARSLDHSVLCSLDLLLPRTGGWSCSQNLQNKVTRDIFSKAGIDFNLENSDEYIEKYLRNFHCRGFLM